VCIYAFLEFSPLGPSRLYFPSAYASNHVDHYPLVDSDRVRTCSQLRITSSKHLRSGLHGLQIQAIRKAIARVVCDQVLKEGVLQCKSVSRHLYQAPSETYQIRTEVCRCTSASHEAVYLDGAIETVSEIEDRATNGHSSYRSEWVSISGQR
jgi:hypothetical protein